MAKTWFKQSVNFTESYVVSSLAGSGFYFEIYLYQKLIELFLNKESSEIKLNAKQFARSLGVRADNLVRSIDRICALCVLSDGCTPVVHCLYDGSTLSLVAANIAKLQESNLQNKSKNKDKEEELEKEKNINIAQPRLSERKPEVGNQDFEDAYSRYPRKVGKSKGISKAKREVKTRDDLASFNQAISNYRAYVLREKTEPAFIKHFSTFVSEWRDWASVDNGRVDADFSATKKQRGIAEILAEEERSRGAS